MNACATVLLEKLPCACGGAFGEVIDSRASRMRPRKGRGGRIQAIRRRRVCSQCGSRATTYELAAPEGETREGWVGDLLAYMDLDAGDRWLLRQIFAALHGGGPAPGLRLVRAET
jgi:hypothetical protein